ncbi:MAG: U32 family peptidase, partial [Desulfovibrionaceae bacterium]|nr:U32 family peptidase [Desulfovibrionaceae bacterium]
MKHQQGLPELLVPAGDMEMLETAAVYRADAVYLGGPELNLRAGARGFGFKALPRALDFARARGMRVYFCLNAYPRQGQLGLVDQYLDQLAEAGPDALIVSDLGVADRARKRVPHIPLHVSTQANTTNSAALAFWREFGARRVNLARETDARALRDILLGRPGLEIEMFVHGAVCMALSGRCLLSAGLNARSANLGLCSHACRFEYRVSSYTVEEKTRPGLDVWEARRLDNDGAYSALFAARDLCLAHYLGWFARLGVSALKIEGRTRSSACLAQVADAYRSALDHLARGCFRPARYLP